MNNHERRIRSVRSARSASRRVVASITAVAFFGLALGVTQLQPQNGHADPNPREPLPLFYLVLSGQQHGYLQPCGCSRPQYGGLARRWNYVESLKKKGRAVVALDLGDIAPKSSPQRDLKYEYSMRSLALMNYKAVSLGKREFDMSLINTLALYRIDHKEPAIVAANILTPKTVKFIRDHVDAWRIVKDPAKKIPPFAAIGLIGRTVSAKVNDPDVAFAQSNAVVLRDALVALRNQVQFAVLLYQGTMDDAKVIAKFSAQLRRQDPAIPPLNVIQCLSREEEPPSEPLTVKEAPETMIVTTGHKGRYVGLISVYPTRVAQRPYAFRYKLVSIGPEYETPEGKEATNPIMALMEEYALRVKQGDYILKYPTVKHPVQVHFPNSKFVGSDRCYGCHEHAYDVWDKSLHSHAFDALTNATRPGLRQFDGECVVCHVVGFNHPTGYADALRNNDKKMIRRLKHVGCEACHGPCSEHVKNPKNMQLRALINPWRPSDEELNSDTPVAKREALKKRRLLRIDLFCQSCHDTDNDVHWNFAKKWPKIVHPTPQKKQAALGRTSHGGLDHPRMQNGSASGDRSSLDAAHHQRIEAAGVLRLLRSLE